MLVACPDCGKFYDDEGRWTICPHAPLWDHVNQYCPKCDTVMAIHGPCEHQRQRHAVECHHQEPAEPERVGLLHGFARALGQTLAVIWYWRTWVWIGWMKFKIWRGRRRVPKGGKVGMVWVGDEPVAEVTSWSFSPKPIEEVPFEHPPADSGAVVRYGSDLTPEQRADVIAAAVRAQCKGPGAPVAIPRDAMIDHVEPFKPKPHEMLFGYPVVVNPELKTPAIKFQSWSEWAKKRRILRILRWW